ncbi:amidohydrolase [Leptolyngbya sp. 7M]|uniref:amidohydrolase n=1 Tax=Leptolyngbya sp. 7M TaxID=2812896 RepID=UPI001B8A9341|nr:amidohydrolase [Leptolyngbya sp. 7M]QYO66169.1 amidohydrolase family protein [Leptolyngbya sp. 7M]
MLVRGARVHNLKNVSVTIPHNKLTVITGVSGSGKSSLAFDTIYAEGQRRFVESLSAYARQFLEQMDKPDVDEITGIAPAIAIRQKNSTKNPRSTVATQTEIYDYLRLLFARAGQTFCHLCGREVKKDSPESAAEEVLGELQEGIRFYVLFPLDDGSPEVSDKPVKSRKSPGQASLSVQGQTVIDFPVPDAKTYAEGLDLTERFIKKWQGHPLIVPAIAPHAPYTVSENNLTDARAMSDRLKAPLLIHLAEADTETKAIQEKYEGKRPIEFLESINFFNERTIAAHVVHANENELDILKRHNVGIAHNPQSNMKLAAGVAPVPMMLFKNMNVGLGTDGAASNNDLNLWEEMDTAAKLHKVFSDDPKVVSAEQVFEMATIRGARALHLGDKIGSIEAGKLADIVIIDIDGLHQTPMYNIYSHLVYATKSSDVRTVIINGRTVMRDRRLLTLNENAIKIDANTYRKKIIESLKN